MTSLKRKFLQEFSLSGLNTPKIIVFKDILQNNIEKMQQKANSLNVKLRPHIKTHKSIEIATMQKDFGAVGITTSKYSEAKCFMKKGFDDVLIAYPIIDYNKALDLFNLKKVTNTKLQMIVDNKFGFNVLNEAYQQSDLKGIKNEKIGIFCKIDVGLHRCGLDIEKDEDSVELLKIVEKIINNEHFYFSGILSHAGQCYGSNNRKEVLDFLEKENMIMSDAKKLIKDAFDLESFDISTGSTPSALVAENFGISTEIRPGNYVFCDRTPLKIGAIDEDEISMMVYGQVISENDEYYITDCGSKTLSSDIRAHGNRIISDDISYGYVFDNNNLHLQKLSEEHGFIKKDDDKRYKKLTIGEKILIYPNHACPVPNLMGEILLYDDIPNSISFLNVSARGNDS